MTARLHGAGYLAIGLLGVLTLTLALCFVSGPAAFASSSSGSITITPASGPVGTTVDVEVIPSTDVGEPITYTLEATTTNPATALPSEVCSNTQPIPGLVPFTVGSQGGHTTFAWPSQLNSPAYWLCARPYSGSGPGAVSAKPFTVIGGRVPTPAPTATPVPVSGVVAVTLPEGGAKAGAEITVQVTHWSNPRGAPATVIFYSQDPSKPPRGDAPHYAADFSIVQSTNDSYVLHVTIPPTVPSGTYWIGVSTSAGEVVGKSFPVAGAPSPTATAASTAATVQTGNGAPPNLLMIGLAALAVLLVLAAGFAGRAIARRRQSPVTTGARRRADTAHPYGRRDDADPYPRYASGQSWQDDADHLEHGPIHSSSRTRHRHDPPES